MANFAALSALVCLLASPALALWPLPTLLETGNTTLTLAQNFTVDVDCEGPPADLLAAVERTKGHLVNDKLQRLVVDRGASDAEKVAAAAQLTGLKLSVTNEVASITDEAIKPLEDRLEGYTLQIPEDGGVATLTANSTLGLLRGLTTFEQIWYDVNDTTYTLEAPFNIVDTPAYPYRGLHLDTSRNYFSKDVLKHHLDAMSMVKINSFHWHVVDSQSFPLIIPGHEDLSENGKYDAESIYTPEDVAEIIAYANERGIDVIGELDTPGHTTIIHNSHPQHIACHEASPWATYANQPPAGQLRIASDETNAYSRELIQATANMFNSPYFSPGGDEVNANCYRDDEETQAELERKGIDIEQALDSFMNNLADGLREVNKTTIVWQEMAIAHNVTMPEDTLIFVWISAADAIAVAKKGYRIIHSASDYFYLDCGAGGWLGDFPGGNSWCDPFKNWQKAYSFDPKANMTETEAKLVMGGQSLLWAEQSDPNNLDSIVWPRAAASAEVFWSGEGGDTPAALPRLHDVSFRMRQRGVRTIALQPLWCTLRPGACDLSA